jgi:uncharacterized protein (TIGR00661 family)
MRILYGVVGEGMGHAMRSGVILEHLEAAGHELRIVGSGRAATYLAKRHPGHVQEITGLTMVYEDNEVQKRKTFWENLRSALEVPENARQYFELARTWSPELVISDFESWTYAFARGQGVPVISVDNMQIIDRAEHDDALIDGDRAAFLLAKSIVKAKLPRANAYLITTFFWPKLRKDRTSLYGPILRKNILEARRRTSSGEHLLVYQTGTSNLALVDALERAGVPCRIYGLRRDLTAPVTEGALTYCPFSEERFVDDLASARAVVAGGGFTLLGEAVALGKPVLSMPLQGHFEQILNATYLGALGYGERADEVDAAALARFLARVPEYTARLATFRVDDNAEFLAGLDAAMDAAVLEGALP